LVKNTIPKAKREKQKPLNVKLPFESEPKKTKAPAKKQFIRL